MDNSSNIALYKHFLPVPSYFCFSVFSCCSTLFISLFFYLMWTENSVVSFTQSSFKLFSQFHSKKHRTKGSWLSVLILPPPRHSIQLELLLKSYPQFQTPRPRAWTMLFVKLTEQAGVTHFPFSERRFYICTSLQRKANTHSRNKYQKTPYRLARG